MSEWAGPIMFVIGLVLLFIYAYVLYRIDQKQSVAEQRRAMIRLMLRQADAYNNAAVALNGLGKSSARATHAVDALGYAWSGVLRPKQAESVYREAILEARRNAEK